MRRLLILAGLLAPAVIGLAMAWAGPFRAHRLVLVSGPSPFAGCTADNVSGQGETNYPNSEVEPWAESNPTNPLNIVVGYQQDRWSTVQARGHVAGVTFDGGRTWTRVVIPKITVCSGGNDTFDRATDPWVSFAPNGDLYFFSLAEDPSERSAVFVNKSVNGGLTWSDPIKLIDEMRLPFFNDKNTITADPGDSNFVYVVWTRLTFALRSPALFARTTDGGQTWEPARIIYEPRGNNRTIAHQIVVLPNGALVDIFNEIGQVIDADTQETRFDFDLSVIRSTDKGATWTRDAIQAAKMQSLRLFRASGVIDPDAGDQVRTGDAFPQIAVDRSPSSPGFGNLYAVWQDARFSNFSHDEIAFSRSTDGGFTWSMPIKVNQTPTDIPPGNRQAFTATIRVAADGTIGVTYYDFRNNTPDPATLPTDYFIVHCHPSTIVSCTDPADWAEETRLTPKSFDMRKAPISGISPGFFLGDYVGLAVVGNDFQPVFVQSGQAAGTSDVFSTAVGP